MLKVRVINLPVFYNGKRYVKDDELLIKPEHENAEIFDFIEKVEINKEPTQEELLKKFYKNNTAEDFKEILTANGHDFGEISDKKELFELISTAGIDVLAE